MLPVLPKSGKVSKLVRYIMALTEQQCLISFKAELTLYSSTYFKYVDEYNYQSFPYLVTTQCLMIAHCLLYFKPKGVINNQWLLH